MSFWFYGRSQDGKRHLYSVGGVFTAAMFLILLLLVLLLPVLYLIREWPGGAN
jgi:hypothetical protein